MLIRFIHLLFSDKVNIRKTTVFTLWVVKLVVGERFGICADAQDRPKRIEWVEAPIEAEGELVPAPGEAGGMTSSGRESNPWATGKTVLMMFAGIWTFFHATEV